MGRYLEISEEEKKQIREKHSNAKKEMTDRKETLKKGVQKIEKKVEKKS